MLRKLTIKEKEIDCNLEIRKLEKETKRMLRLKELELATLSHQAQQLVSAQSHEFDSVFSERGRAQARFGDNKVRESPDSTNVPLQASRSGNVEEKPGELLEDAVSEGVAGSRGYFVKEGLLMRKWTPLFASPGDDWSVITQVVVHHRKGGTGYDIHPCPGPGVISIDLPAGGPDAELHTPSAGFRRGWLAEQLAPPAGLCGLALTAADLAAGPLPTPLEDYGSAPTASGRAAEIHTPPARFRGDWMASTPSEDCGSAPKAYGQAVEIHAPPDTTGHHRTSPDTTGHHRTPPDTTGHHRTGFRGGRLAEQLALPAGLGGLALTAAGLAAGPTSTPLEDGGPPTKAKGIAAEIHASSVPIRDFYT
ncbi:hypothetical protein NQZ68_027312 [Dissostichus eleginoides]|nr:hypothetical protein NQZ68_027312 [Dissostichus eleginoides]